MSWEVVGEFDLYLLPIFHLNEIATNGRILSKLYGEVALG